MGTTPSRSLRAFTCYVAVTGAAVAVHQVLPASARPLSYSLILATTLVPLSLLVRRSTRRTRLPWSLLLSAMVVLAIGSWITAAGGGAVRALGDQVVTVGHALILASALTLVVIRGRNDLGGLIDAAVALMGLGSLLWACLLQPGLAAIDAPLTARITVLVTIFVLCGVLGALGRVWFVSGRLLALQLLVYALLIALVGNSALALTSGSMTADRPRWVETLFLIAYLCVGAATLHPTVHELSRPGPAPVDRLSGGRLVFLGAAMVIGPLVGGARQLLGLPADGLLLALGTLAVAPFVMLRIHRLSAQREAAEQALLHQATHDSLTGLPNRAELLTRLATALGRERAAAARHSVVLLFCDLNGFKLVNDRFGHAAGDQLLVEVARRLRTGLRADDSVARYGGDEFLVLCENGSPETVTRLRAHIQSALSTPIEVGGEQVRVGVSIGAVTSNGLADADELIRRADTLMYQAKRQRHPAARESVARPTTADAGTAV